MSKKNNNRDRRLLRNRSKIKSKNISSRPRIVVAISNKNTHCQLIGDNGNVIASFSTLKIKDFKGTGIEKAQEVGKEFAKICLKSNHKDVVLDKGIRVYNGRLKSFAQSCRESGLNF
jgi:large subunit ribosomal protein L18